MKLLRYFLLLVGAVLIAFILYFGPVYTYRVFVWQGSDYDDFSRFKTKPIKSSEDVFQFHKGSEENVSEVSRIFQIDDRITNLDQFLEDQETYAFLVIRNDSIQYEKYFNGSTRNSIQTSFSTSKSILSLLVGIAIDEKSIGSINDPITKYLPELLERDEKFSNISIEELLRMRSGIKFQKGVAFPFVTSDEPLTYSHPDLRSVALNYTEIIEEADSKFLYNDYNALLTGLILERATGQSVSSYLEQRIWTKIGMEYDASWNCDERKFEQMQSGLNARPIDFAKIGKLIVNHGRWQNNQIVDSLWIEQSTMPRDTFTFNSGQKWSYGYFWWNVLKPDTHRDVFACGHMGQFIYISPLTNTIIIRHGLEVGNIDDDDWTEIFCNYVSRQY